MTPQVVADIEDERARQDAKWGEQNRCPTAWIAICVEELGKTTKHALTLDLIPGHPQIVHERECYRLELVQLAACVVAALEAFDRGKWAPAELHARNEGKPEN